jgi:hypothetical protein
MGWHWTGEHGQGPEWVQDTAELAERALFDADEDQIGQVEGHLLCHFTLHHDPIPRRVNPLDEMVLGLREVLGTATSRQSRRLRAIEALPRRRSSQSQLSPAAFSVLERHFRRG